MNQPRTDALAPCSQVFVREWTPPPSLSLSLPPSIGFKPTTSSLSDHPRFRFRPGRLPSVSRLGLGGVQQGPVCGGRRPTRHRRVTEERSGLRGGPGLRTALSAMGGW